MIETNDQVEPAEAEHVPDQTFEQLFESLNGFEEIAIHERFGVSIGKLADDNETLFMRALVFTDMVRSGLSPGDARSTVMAMRLVDVKGWFLADGADVMPDDPDSAAGKDDSRPASTPRISPPSA